MSADKVIFYYLNKNQKAHWRTERKMLSSSPTWVSTFLFNIVTVFKEHFRI